MIETIILTFLMISIIMFVTLSTIFMKTNYKVIKIIFLIFTMIIFSLWTYFTFTYANYSNWILFNILYNYFKNIIWIIVIIAIILSLMELNENYKIWVEHLMKSNTKNFEEIKQKNIRLFLRLFNLISIMILLFMILK